MCAPLKVTLRPELIPDTRLCMDGRDFLAMLPEASITEALFALHREAIGKRETRGSLLGLSEAVRADGHAPIQS